MSRRYYEYFYRQRGLWFVVRVFPLHYLYHVYNGFSFATGTLLYTVKRWTRIGVPGALPIEAWSPVKAAQHAAGAGQNFRARSTSTSADANRNVVGV